MAMLNHQRVPMWTTYSLLPNPAMGKSTLIISNRPTVSDLFQLIPSSFNPSPAQLSTLEPFLILKSLKSLKSLISVISHDLSEIPRKITKKNRWKSLGRPWRTAPCWSFASSQPEGLHPRPPHLLQRNDVKFLRCLGITENRCVEQPNK